MEKTSVLVSLIAQMLQFVSQKGISPEKLLRESGVDPEILRDPDNRISIDKYNSIQNRAVELSGDSYFGLHMGEFAMTNSMSIVGFVMMNCGTIEEAIKKAIVYHEIVGNLIQISLQEDEERIMIELSPRIGSYGHTQHCYNASVSSLLRIMRLLSGDKFKLDSVWFMHEPPEFIEEFKRILNCEIQFNRPKTAVFFHKRNLTLPVIQANPGMLALLEKHAKELLAGIKSENVYSRKVSQLILSKLNGDPPSINSIAKDLAVSVRKLQQKLSEEKTSFSEILKTTRLNLSKDYLKQNEHSMSEIAFLLGFSEPGVFSKAFIKWTGFTPLQYRKNVS